MRRGVTLVELMVVLAILGSLLGVAFPRVAGWLDGMAVDRAALEIVGFHHEAQFAALLRAERVRLRFTEDSLTATFEGVRDSTFIARAGPGRHGVRLTATREEVRFYPNGLGFGAANTKIVLRRGEAVDSITTSRLGRLKRWR
ncbi:MAG TPA: prepilin-type N-terminal cleavage/methylation domain-containing protein [Gemmatimonadales bacterium]